MRFHIGFVHKVNAIFVAEVIPYRYVRIVRGADHIHVDLFYKLDVLNHPAYGDDEAGVGVVLVAVDAFEYGRDAVDEYLAVSDFDLAKAKITALDLNDFSGSVFQRQHHNIEIRYLSRPLSRIGDISLHFDNTLSIGGDIFHLAGHQWFFANRFAVSVQHRYFHSVSTCSAGGVVVQLCCYFQHRIAVPLTKVTVDKEITQMHLWRREEIHITVDST